MSSRFTVKVNNPREEAAFVYDNKLLTLKQGISARARALYRRIWRFLVALRSAAGPGKTGTCRISTSPRPVDFSAWGAQ